MKYYWIAWTTVLPCREINIHNNVIYMSYFQISSHFRPLLLILSHFRPFLFIAVHFIDFLGHFIYIFYNVLGHQNPGPDNYIIPCAAICQSAAVSI